MHLTLERVSKVVASETHLHPLDLDAAAGGGQRGAGRHPGRQDHPAAADGRAGPPQRRPPAGRRRQDVTGVLGAPARPGHGLPAVHQLPVADGVREHRLAAAHRRTAGQRRSARGWGAIAETLRLTPLPRAPPGRAVGRPAAAHGHGPRAGQGGGAAAAGRAARPTWTTSCARSCGWSWRPCSTRGGPRWCTPPPSPRRRCSWAGTPACCTRGGCCSRGPTLEVFAAPVVDGGRRARSAIRPSTCFRPPGMRPAARISIGDREPGERPDLAPACRRTRPSLPEAARAGFFLGVRAHHLRLATPARRATWPCGARVDLAEIDRLGDASCTSSAVRPERWCCRCRGCRRCELGSACTVYLDPGELFGFARDGALLFAPPGERLTWPASSLRRSAHSLSTRARRARATTPADHDLGGRRRLRPAGSLRLRQDHPAQHHLRACCARPQGQVLFDGQDVTAAAARRRATSPRCSSSRSSTTP